MVAKEDEQLEKGGSTGDVQDVAFLDLDHSASCTADQHSAETKVSSLGLYTVHTVVFELINIFREECVLNLYISVFEVFDQHCLSTVINRDLIKLNCALWVYSLHH